MSKCVFVILLFLSASVGAATYVSAEQGLSFNYDESKWIESKTKATVGEQQTLVSLQRKEATEKYHARFSVVIESLDNFKSKKDPLRAYYLKASKFLRDQRFGNFQVREGSDVLPGTKTFGFEIIATQRDFGLTFRQVIVAHKGNAYLFSAACRTSEFSTFKKEISNLSNSIRLSN